MCRVIDHETMTTGLDNSRRASSVVPATPRGPWSWKARGRPFGIRDGMSPAWSPSRDRTAPDSKPQMRMEVD